MNKLITLLALFISLSNFSDCASLEGDISTSTVLNGKVNVLSDVSVASNVTLTFEAGTVLIFEPGVSIKTTNWSSLVFNGTQSDPILILPRVPGTFLGSIESFGIGSFLEMHFVKMRGGHLSVRNGAAAILEDSYFSDYYNGVIPIIRSEDAASVQIRKSMVSNYYEINLIRTLTLIEDCIFQFMTADGIDLDNSPAGTTIQRSTVRYGKGTNIDAIDFGKVSFTGNGSIGLVKQCLIHDISDKGISVGEGAQEITAEGNVFYNCGAGVAVKDNSLSRIYNNTFVSNDVAIELVEKNPGLGGGHGYTYNNIFWNNSRSFYLNSTSTVDIRYSDIEDMTADTALFIFSADPRFINSANKDFRLHENSPAINTGFGGVTLGAYFPVGMTFGIEDPLHLGLPNSFSRYSINENIDIIWSANPELEFINILFSEDGGSSWQSIANGIPANQLQYNWTIPAIYSTRCKIKIESSANPAIQSENYLPFSISPVLSDAFSPSFSIASGYYSSEQLLSLTSQHGDLIFYTLDGSDPSDQSLLYSSPISLRFDSIPAGQSEQNITAFQGPHQPYSYIRTAPVSQIGPNPSFWYMPTGQIFKATVVNARVYRPGVGLGPIITHSYFIDPDMLNGRYTLPIISLVSDPKHLFDYYSGVYIPGADFTGYSFTGNYERKGRASEQPAHIEFFNTNGREEFSMNIGFRVRGEWIRSMGQKALTIYSRSEYDEQNKFDYELYPGLLRPGTKLTQNKFKRFVIRNAGNEWGWSVNSLCRDMLNQSLFDRLDLKYQAGRPSIVFLNGEYWGIQNIRELNDKRGLEYAYGLNPDSLIMMEDNLDGPFQLVSGNDGDVHEFHDMRDFMLSHDLSVASNYNQVTEMLDVENFRDYWIATIYSNKKNTDHNTSYWKLRNGHPGSGVQEVFDGRWRWMANDFDNGLDLVAFDNLSYMLQIMPDSLLKRMLTNPSFRESFLSRFADLLNSSFNTNHVLKRIDYYHQILEPEIPEHINRWRTPATMLTWEEALTNFKDFALDRPQYQFDQLQAKFGISAQHQVTVDVPDQIMGYIQLNTLKLDQSLPGINAGVYPWTGNYFEQIPVSISALPYSGYRFVKWMETGETNPMISLNLTADLSRTAVFEWDPVQALSQSSVYPNPVRGSDINFKAAALVSIFDVTGREVLRSDVPVIRFDVSSLRKGVYTVRLNNEEAIQFVKL